MDAENCLIWNVRGLNARAHRDMVRTVVDQENVSLLCLQQTKLSVINDQVINEMLGPSFAYDYIPAQNTREGILLAWRSHIWSASNFLKQDHSLTAKLTLLVDGFSTWVTTVYGPHADADKVQFLNELRQLRQSSFGPWMLCGDFNMIYNAADKNNENLHRRAMGRFRRFLNDL